MESNNTRDVLSIHQEEGREDRGHVLMTWVSGSAIRLIEDKTDQEVVDMCVDVLRKVFSDKVSSGTIMGPSTMVAYVARRFQEMLMSYVTILCFPC